MLRSAHRKLLAALLWGSFFNVSLGQDVDGCDDPNLPCDAQSMLDLTEGCDSFDAFNHSDRCDLWTRETLTGDWGGRRKRLADSGIKFAARSTHFAFGVDGGVIASPVPALGPGNTFEYTGRGEYDALFDLEKFGGLPYGSLLVRAEHWYGEYGNVSLNTGAFPPAVFPAALPPVPNDPGVPYITNFLLTQPLSKEFVVFAGKKDVLGSLDQDDFAGGDGTDQFMNQALIANPAFLLGLPYTSFTMGAVMLPEWGTVTTYIYDPRNRTQDFFQLDDLFATGVIVGGEAKARTNLFGKKGHQHVGAMWKHTDLTDLRFNEPPPGEYPTPVVPGFPTLADSYTIYYGFDQYLAQFSENNDRGYGLFSRASISDGNPTPIRYFLSAGIGGFNPIIGRQRGDTFGLGWYYTGASTEFGPLPQALFGPRDGTGVELFHNFQITKWMNLTPDVQYIRPEAAGIADDSFVYGIRLNVRL
jgi:porin